MDCLAVSLKIAGKLGEKVEFINFRLERFLARFQRGASSYTRIGR